MNNRGQFTFYRNYWDAVKLLPKKYRLDVLSLIIEYSLTRTVADYNPEAFVFFSRLKPAIDAEIREAKEGRRSTEYKKWRASVFERDNYTCVVCGRRGCRLNAHHVKSYAHHPDLRYEISNGVTLCENCHKLLHRIMRKGW